MRRRTPSLHARRDRSTPRDVAAAVAILVGAGALVSFDAAAESQPAEPTAAGPVAATAVTPGARTIPGVEPATVPVAHRTATAERYEAVAAAEAERAAELAAEREAAEAEAAAARAAERAAVWDRLADCESGAWDRDRTPIPGSARWDYGLNPSEDGFFQGGLQFHPVTWDEFRDADMPDHAGNASREQQVAIAERVLDVQGWGAWPVCSRKLGYR